MEESFREVSDSWVCLTDLDEIRRYGSLTIGSKCSFFLFLVMNRSARAWFKVKDCLAHGLRRRGSVLSVCQCRKVTSKGQKEGSQSYRRGRHHADIRKLCALLYCCIVALLQFLISLNTLDRLGWLSSISIVSRTPFNRFSKHCFVDA